MSALCAVLNDKLTTTMQGLGDTLPMRAPSHMRRRVSQDVCCGFVLALESGYPISCLILMLGSCRIYCLDHLARNLKHEPTSI
jgi:hypothetical protein